MWLFGYMWDAVKFLLCVLLGLVVVAHTSFVVRRAQAHERRQARQQRQQQEQQQARPQAAATAQAVAVTRSGASGGDDVPESWKPPADERAALAAVGITSPQALMLLQAMRVAARGARERGHVAGCRCHWCAEMSYGGPIDQAQEGSAA